MPLSAEAVVNNLISEGIAAGFPVGKYYEDMDDILLLAFTEKRTKEEIDIFLTKLESAINN